MKKLIIILRFLLFIPAMIMGGFLSVIPTMIWNIPLFFLEALGGLFGNLNFSKFIFGSLETSFSEILFHLSSGVFFSALGLYFAVSVFPLHLYRSKAVYFLTAWILIGLFLSSQFQLSYNGNIFYFLSNILGVFIGSWIVVRLLKDSKQQKLFKFVDKLLE